MNKKQKLIFSIIAFLLIIPYVITANLDLIDIDSSQYGEIVREMAETNEYYRISDNGRKYLDKPIMTFWTVLPFFEVLGPSNFSFRIPALLITALSICALYHMVLLIWGSELRAWIAIFSYISAPGLYAMVIDPKIDVYLTAYLIFTHYFYYLGRKKNCKFYYFMYISIGLGFITKGPISLVIPIISIGMDILFRRDWKLLKEMQLLTGIPIAMFFPALWSYLLFREYASYGPAFFLWIQSFGRFYKDLYDVGYQPFFFLQNFAWAFFTFFFFLMIGSLKLFNVKSIKKSLSNVFKRILNNHYKNKDFTFYLWLYLFLFLISFSRFQLPQYIFWILPPAAVIFSGMAMDLLRNRNEQFVKFYKLSSIVTGILFYLALLIIPIIMFSKPWNYYWIILISIVLYFLIKKYMTTSLALPMSGVFGGFLLVSVYIYTTLLYYQPAQYFGSIIQAREPHADIVYSYRISSSKRSYSFYSNRLFRNIYDSKKFQRILNEEKKRLVIVPEKHFSEFQLFLGTSFYYKVIEKRPSIKVATPPFDFFIHEKRKKIEGYILLVEVLLEDERIEALN